MKDATRTNIHCSPLGKRLRECTAATVTVAPACRSRNVRRRPLGGQPKCSTAPRCRRIVRVAILDERNSDRYSDQSSANYSMPPARNSLWQPVPASHKVRPGEVITCDFGELLPPEMTKIRPVVVISRQRANTGSPTLLVVPISSVAPGIVMNHHVELATNLSPWKTGIVTSWAKCDMAYAVARQRLSFIVRRGVRFTIRLSADELHRVRLGSSTVLFGNALGTGSSCPCQPLAGVV